MRKNFSLSAVMLALLAIVPLASAQWLTQTVMVTNGWTAAYLYVDASAQPILPSAANTPISPGNPIDQIWLWKPPVSYAQYVTTPDAPLTGGGRWLTWSRTNSVNSLGALIPNAAYLIHSTGANAYAWQIKGRPAPPSYIWDLTGLNFIGYPTPSSSAPSFQNFFAPAVGGPTNANMQVYQYVGGPMATNGSNPAFVYSKYATPVTRGQAYWVNATNLGNPYFGPFKLSLPDTTGLNYTSTLSQLTLHLANLGTNPLTVTLTLLPSEAPPAGQAAIAGLPPLLVRGGLLTTNPITYACACTNLADSYSVPLPAPGQPGADVTVVVGINRFAMTGAPGSFYAGILRLTDSLHLSQIDLPVSATTVGTAGLWVGAASITAVQCDLDNYATNADGSLVLTGIATNRVPNPNINLSSFTNVATQYYLATNVVITDYTVSNLVVNTFNFTNYNTTTNFTVVSTNLSITNWSATNLVIETDFAGYDYDANGQIVWETANTTNGPATVRLSVTNFVFVTNIVAGAGTTMATLWETNTYCSSFALVTNDLFGSPVTNITTYLPYTQVTNWAAAETAAATVLTTAAGGSLQTILATVTNVFATNNWVTTNAMESSLAVNAPFYVSTNRLGQALAFTLFTNSFYAATVATNFWTTNWVVVSNFFELGDQGYSLASSSTNEVAAGMSYAVQTTADEYDKPYLAIYTNSLYTNLVSYSTNSSYQATAVISNGAVAAPFPLRLILFNGTNGACTLLQHVYYGFDVHSNIIITTTESALDPSRLSVARRISAAHLPWTANNARWTSGPLALGASNLNFTVDEPYDDQAANPFLHTYHPDHNNLALSSDPTVPATELGIGAQSYDLTRQITLNLQAAAGDFTSLTTASSSLAGIYSETITLTGAGGFSRAYHTSGYFSLICISQIPTLTTQ